jgi:hypothetical protein
LAAKKKYKIILMTIPYLENKSPERALYIKEGHSPSLKITGSNGP